LEQYDSVQLVSAALKLLTGDKNDVKIELTPEDPIRAKKRRPDGRSSSSGRGFNRDRERSVKGDGYRRRTFGSKGSSDSRSESRGEGRSYGRRDNSSSGRNDFRRSSE